MKNTVGKILLTLLPLLAASVAPAQTKPDKSHGDRGGSATTHAAPQTSRSATTTHAAPQTSRSATTTHAAPQTGRSATTSQRQAPNPPSAHRTSVQANPPQLRGEHRPPVHVPPPAIRPHDGRPGPPSIHGQPSHRPNSDRIFGYRHPPRDHGDREGFRWIPGRGSLEGRWAPYHRPGRLYIWIPGHWRGDMWINGHWRLPRRY